MNQETRDETFTMIWDAWWALDDPDATLRTLWDIRNLPTTTDNNN